MENIAPPIQLGSQPIQSNQLSPTRSSLKKKWISIIGIIVAIILIFLGGVYLFSNKSKTSQISPLTSSSTAKPATSNKGGFPEFQINILNIKEIPIKNEMGNIENIKFIISLDPNTPVPNGKYGWNNCWLESKLPHEVYWQSDNSYHNSTLIGSCPLGQKAVVENNSLETLLDEDTIKHIVKCKLNGPYLLFMSNNFFDYSQPNTTSVTYTLNLKDKELYNSLCEVDNAKIKAGEFEKDRCGETIKNNKEYLIIKLPYKTASYSYTQFVEN